MDSRFRGNDGEKEWVDAPDRYFFFSSFFTCEALIADLSGS